MTEIAAPDDEPPGMRAAGAIEGVLGRAVVRIDAETRVREFGQVGAADDHRAGFSQAFDDCRVARRRRRADQHLRAAERDDACFVEQVLDRNRDARERGQLRAAASLRVHAVGGSKRFAFVDEEEGARAFSRRILDRRERLLDELAAGDLPIGKQNAKARR